MVICGGGFRVATIAGVTGGAGAAGIGAAVVPGPVIKALGVPAQDGPNSPPGIEFAK